MRSFLRLQQHLTRDHDLPPVTLAEYVHPPDGREVGDAGVVQNEAGVPNRHLKELGEFRLSGHVFLAGDTQPHPDSLEEVRRRVPLEPHHLGEA